MHRNGNVERFLPNGPMSISLRRRLEKPNKRPNLEKIVIMGGTGCIGEYICKHATSRSYNIWSLSKNFPYSFSSHTTGMQNPAKEDEEPWPLQVTWKRFNVMLPFARERLAADLKGAKTLIHCIGQQRLSKI